MILKSTHFLIILLFISGISVAQKPRLIIDSKGHTGIVNELIFLDNGRKLISVSNDKSIRLWDVNTGGLIRTMYVNQTDGYHGRIYSAAISPDEKVLAIGGFFGKPGDSLAIGSIYLIDLDKPSRLRQLKSHTNVVTDLIIAGDKLVSSSADKSIKIWSLGDQPKLTKTLSKHRYPISSMAFAPGVKQLASADIGGNVLIWNLETGDVVSDKIGKFHEGAISSLAFSDDESNLFTGGADGKVIQWTTTGKFLKTLQENQHPINSMAFLPGKNQLLSLNIQGTIQSTVTGSSLLEFHEHNNTVSAVDVAPFAKFADMPGTFVATAGGDEKEIYIWNTENGTIVRKFGGHGHAIFATGASPEQTSIAFGQSNPTGILDDAPLEKSLNLTDFSLKEIAVTDKFLRHDVEHMGSKIQKESAHVLNYETGTISIDEQKDGEIRSYTFLKDHSMIAIGSTFGIPLFDRNGKPVSKLLGHGGELWSVCPFGSDMLLSSSADQTIKIWNYTTQELLLTFFPANDREWVIWSPSGYYHASAGGEKYIGWLINKTENDLAEFHEVSEFRDQYHNPELIKAILKERSLEKASKLLNIVVAKPDDILKLLPPEITWIEPSGYTATTSSPLYNIKAIIKSNNPVKSLKLIINGRPYVTKMEDFRIDKADNGVTIQYALDFTKVSVQARGLEVVPASDVDQIKKEVSIQIFVENEISGAVTDARTVSYQQQSNNRITPQPNTTGPSDNKNSVVAFPNLYLITIGISSFQNPAYNLNYADDDARSIESVFKDQQGKLFNKVYSLSLINENATRAKIISTFDRLKPVVSAQDYVVIFIATHGINKNNQFYILPHDGDATNANITCVNWRDFSDIVGNLPSQVLLMIDACHSGQLGKNLGQIRSDNTEAVREISSGEYGVVIMAASTGSEYSLEHPDWAHGAFTLSIIEGLENRKADIRADGAIFLRELDFYVAERVKDLTQNQQHPTTQKPSTISAMPIIKY